MILGKLTSLFCAFTLLGVQSCKSAPDYKRGFDGLSRAGDALSKQDFKSAEREATGVVRHAQSDPNTFALQRFYAMCLLAEVHALAGTGAAFLPEAVSAQNKDVLVVAEGAGSGPTDRSEAAHIVASEMFASIARGWLSGIENRPQVVDNQPLLPPALAALSPTDKKDTLRLLRVIADQRLGFQDDLDRDLGQARQDLTLENFYKFVERVQLPQALRPWAAYAVFKHLHSRNVAEAFRFGVTALTNRDDTRGSLGAREEKEFGDWYALIEAQTPFICPKCKEALVLKLLRCPQDTAVKAVDFVQSSAKQPNKG